MSHITMQHLGQCGRFGNQLFQYTFLKTYAKQWNLTVQVPPWVGQKIYGFQDEPVTIKLPTRRERYHGKGGQPIPPYGREFVRTNFFGNAQFHTAYYRPNCNYIRKLFTPKKDYCEYLDQEIQKIRGSQKTLVGLHIRRGDYGQRIFPKTPLKWFLTWLNVNWPRYEDPQLVIATEDRNLISAFKTYDPKLLPENPPRGMPSYFPDFYLLSQCDVLAISESSFSFFAAMLNTSLKELWRSRMKIEGFEQIDPWDAFPLPREHIDAYPHLKKQVTTDADCLDPNPNLQNSSGHSSTLLELSSPTNANRF